MNMFHFRVKTISKQLTSDVCIGEKGKENQLENRNFDDSAFFE